MEVFHLALLHITGEADVMVGRQQQAGAFSLQPFADRGNFLRIRLLLGENVVESEHHESIGVREYALIDRQLESGLVDTLEHGDRMAGRLAGNSLEAERRAVKQLQGPRDPLKE